MENRSQAANIKVRVWDVQSVEDDRAQIVDVKWAGSADWEPVDFAGGDARALQDGPGSDRLDESAAAAQPLPRRIAALFASMSFQVLRERWNALRLRFSFP